MARVLTKVFSSVNHISLAAEVINSVGDAISIYAFLCALPKVFLFCEANTILYAILEHLATFLTQGRVLFVVWLCKPLPCIFNEAHFKFIILIQSIITTISSLFAVNNDLSATRLLSIVESLPNPPKSCGENSS